MGGPRREGLPRRGRLARASGRGAVVAAPSGSAWARRATCASPPEWPGGAEGEEGEPKAPGEEGLEEEAVEEVELVPEEESEEESEESEESEERSELELAVLEDAVLERLSESSPARTASLPAGGRGPCR